MEFSSGIILYRKNSNNITEFFVCTPDGPFWKFRELWNFPKGHLEDDETPFQTALREFKEETNIDLDNDESKYFSHGLISQNKNKKVFVFSKPYENEDTNNCYSNECVSNYHGVEIKHREIKDYAWKTYDELVNKGMQCYLPIFKEICGFK